MARQPNGNADPRPDLDRARPAGRSAPDCRPPGLPRESGLDPTTFNKSKRITPDGRARWPSTESVAKALAATNSPDRHLRAADRATPRASCSRCRCSASRKPAPAAISTTAAFRPARAGTRSRCPRSTTSTPTRWRFPATAMKPAYRDGDVIVVSPAAPIRRGDRVVVKTHGRRSDGQGAEAPHRQDDSNCSRSMPPPADRTLAATEVDLDRADRVGEVQ